MPATTEVPFTRQISAAGFKFTTGTWTVTNGTGFLYALKTANAETNIISIPINLDRRDLELGVKLTSIEVPFRITVADLTSVIVGTLYRNNMKAVTAGGVNIDATAITGTETGAAVTSAATDRLYTFTITNPAYDFATQDECSYQLDLSLVCPASTVVRAYGAVVHFSHPA